MMSSFHDLITLNYSVTNNERRFHICRPGGFWPERLSNIRTLINSKWIKIKLIYKITIKLIYKIKIKLIYKIKIKLIYKIDDKRITKNTMNLKIDCWKRQWIKSCATKFITATNNDKGNLLLQKGRPPKKTERHPNQQKRDPHKWKRDVDRLSIGMRLRSLVLRSGCPDANIPFSGGAGHVSLQLRPVLNEDASEILLFGFKLKVSAIMQCLGNESFTKER